MIDSIKREIRNQINDHHKTFKTQVNLMSEEEEGSDEYKYWRDSMRQTLGIIDGLEMAITIMEQRS